MSELFSRSSILNNFFTKPEVLQKSVFFNRWAKEKFICSFTNADQIKFLLSLFDIAKPADYN